MGGEALPAGKGHSGTVGIVMVIFGAVIAFLSYLRYRNIERQLNNSQYFPSPVLSAIVAISIVIASILLVIYLLPSV
jgi:uncharacterized membrane protein YidH (DUF202 family)